MALKYKFKTKEEIPAEQLPLYTERDGAWLLDVDGAVDKAKLDEFRKNNVALAKERDELKQRYDGIDAEVARALLAERQKAEEEMLLNNGGEQRQTEKQQKEPQGDERQRAAERERIERVIEGRIKTIKGDLEKQVASLAAERDSLTARLTAVQIDQGVVTVATKRGLRPTALTDIAARARAVFRLVNGAPAAFEADGKTVRYGRDGLTPMTLEEWVDTMVTEAPHLFESHAGGGAASNASGGGAANTRLNGLQKNPFRKETWNLTEQMRLLKKDPQLAARLRTAAAS